MIAGKLQMDVGREIIFLLDMIIISGDIFMQLLSENIELIIQMLKGLLLISVQEVESDHFKSYSLILKAEEATFTHFVAEGHKGHYFNNYQLFPATPALEILLIPSQESETREGYFKIPMAKLYELPKKNHLINVKCVWLEKENSKITNDVCANVKLSIVYHNVSKGSFQIYAKEALLERDTEVVGKMDPYLVIRLNQVESKTNTLDNAGSNPKWNERFDYVFDTVPSKIQFDVYDRDVTANDLVGKITINPLQEGYFTPSENEIERNVQINYEGQKAGNLVISTHFKVQD